MGDKKLKRNACGDDGGGDAWQIEAQSQHLRLRKKEAKRGFQGSRGEKEGRKGFDEVGLMEDVDGQRKKNIRGDHEETLSH
ncbi:hypothetical protein FNV43_RR24369 [Rhamnella rubrinervis]|uniref:Uncharacterized protein n=1 Tax=Rhamnella rubrinervis TaxID=2594499 RepID=A0A8K0DXZ0_9ROSA|nr:hypothetical protein FNV43_RR24369 [Rhamnella rubrinervis]